ncbi:MAG: hypothetical protein V1720_02810 [bacterium]
MNSKYKLIIISLLLISIQACHREEINEPVDDGLPPSVPTGLYVYYAFDGEIGIEWNENPEADISHYLIYRRTESTSKFNKIFQTNDLYFFEDSLEYDSTYIYAITAVDEYDRESEFSNIVSANPKNIFRPSFPFGIKINARNWNDSISINLNWRSPYDTDIDHYNIFRSLDANFEPSDETLVGSAKIPEFIDQNNFELLKMYYYKIITVDRGGFKSNPSSMIYDVILNPPQLIFPENNSEINELTEYIIHTVSQPADYKIVLQSNEIYGVLKEINFSTDNINSAYSVAANFSFEQYKDYYVKVYVYSGYSEEPNSFSAMHIFRIVP